MIRLEAQRYRCIEQLNAALSSYTVLVGRNGAEKSTLVDIPILLGEMLQKQSTRAVFFGPTAGHVRPRACRLGSIKSSRTTFAKIFEAVSSKALNQCTEPGFIALRQTLRTWFSKQNEAWE